MPNKPKATAPRQRITVTSEGEARQKMLSNLFPRMQRIHGAMQWSPNPQMAAAEGTNNLAQLAWKIVAEEQIETFVNLFAPLSEFAHNFSSQMVASRPGVTPTLQVPLIHGAGKARKNLEDWDTTALDESVVEISMDRYSRPFTLSYYDFANGSLIEQKLGAVLEAVNELVWEDTLAAIAASGTSALTIATQEEFGPEYAAQTISSSILPRVDALLIHPTLYSRLVPVNALSLGFGRGTYDIGQIYKITGSEHLGETAVGLAAYSQGLGIAAAPPQIATTGAIHVIEIPLSKLGFSILLKQWDIPNKEKIGVSAELCYGCKVIDPKWLRIIKQTTATPAQASIPGFAPTVPAPENN